MGNPHRGRFEYLSLFAGYGQHHGWVNASMDTKQRVNLGTSSMGNHNDAFRLLELYSAFHNYRTPPESPTPGFCFDHGIFPLYHCDQHLK
ncbi:hypothetical protein Y032_0024g983 [Ancylostoma ceylanicum]|uniref:Uncharacterized protein n=1 Tax=Ancylostoma ceylanicum TaxID=53326 RepID=A0A016UY04_9BILA|nr:hypothetical protein Y032_0024g983 [Ancylostoma ceylanicum]